MHYSLSNSLGRGKPPFSPLSLSPALWLDAADPLTLYTGGSLAAPDGAISQWLDKSGNGNHATQATGVSQPLRKTSIQNGRDIVRLDGANDYFEYGTNLFTYTGAATVFAVTARTTTEVGGYGSIISEGGIGGGIACSPNRFPNAEFRPATDIYAPGGVDHGANYTATDPHVIVWGWSNWSTHKTNGDTIVRVDGNAGTPTAYGSNPSALAAGMMQIGRFSADPGADSFLGMDLAELIVFDSALSAANRQKVEDYLALKWGITLA